MKFHIVITKDIIDESLMHGVPSGSGVPSFSCAFENAYRKLIPHVCVSHTDIMFIDIPLDRHIWQPLTVRTTKEQKHFIDRFDKMRTKPNRRYSLVGREFDIDIPDEVIDHYYSSHVEAAQKLIDNPVLQVYD